MAAARQSDAGRGPDGDGSGARGTAFRAEDAPVVAYESKIRKNPKAALAELPNAAQLWDGMVSGSATRTRTASPSRLKK